MQEPKITSKYKKNTLIVGSKTYLNDKYKNLNREKAIIECNAIQVLISKDWKDAFLKQML